MHPLIDNLENLTMDELQNKYNDLTKKMTMAGRYGSGSMMGQMLMVLESYKAELDRRQQKMLENAAGKSKNFKNIIDIQ